MIGDLSSQSWVLLGGAVTMVCVFYFWWGKILGDEAGRVAKERGEYGTYIEGVKDALSQEENRPIRQSNIQRFRKYMDEGLLRRYRNYQIALWIAVALVVSSVIYQVVVL